MARSGLLHVSGHECRQAEGRRALRLHLQPQFRRPSGPRWADTSCVSCDGRCGGGHWASHGRADALGAVLLCREFVAPSLVYLLYTSLDAPAHVTKFFAPSSAVQKNLTGSTSTVTRTEDGTFTVASQALR